MVLYIGMNSQDLTVSGSVYANSDRRLKDNIKNADLDTIQDVFNQIRCENI